MKNKAYDLGRRTFSSKDTLLLDANVWLFLYPAPSDKSLRFAGKYSAAFKQILAAKSPLVLDVLILSEYANRYCRIEWEALYRATYPKFKQFRSSPDFASVGQAAAFFVREILRLCSRHDHLFSSADISQVLTDFESGTADLNDGLLADACRQRAWTLITDDGDFTNGGIEVLTNNPRLIRACR
jgi:hypothetical protein